MDIYSRRVECAHYLRYAAVDLLKASEHACELDRFELSSKLLEVAADLFKSRRELLELPLNAATLEHQLDLPF